jgi:hypothetical protein
MGGQSNDPTLAKMFDEMARSMPLRAMVLFAGGTFKPRHLEILLDVLNGNYLAAMSKLFVRR